MVATKIMAVTAMAGAQTRTINNQLKAVAATATKTMMVTATMLMTTTMMAMAVAVAVTVGGGGGGPCRSRKLGGRGEDMAKRWA